MKANIISLKLFSNFNNINNKQKKIIKFYLKLTYYRNDPREQLFRNQNKYFALPISSRSRHNFVLDLFFRKQIRKSFA